MTATPALFGSEVFPHLAKAPITEAIFQLQARAGEGWTEEKVVPKLKEQLPDYPVFDSQRIFGGRIFLDPSIPMQKLEEQGWNGILFKTADKLHVANFQTKAFSFSRLAPYEKWESFSSEALRLCEKHLSLAQPLEFGRLGLRFVNQIEVIEELGQFSDYLAAAPSPQAGGLPLAIAGFFHNETYALPGTPYAVTVIKTFQPALTQGGINLPAKVILDLDVFTTMPTVPDFSLIRDHVENMRVVKNKVFFANLGANALNHLK